MKHDFVNEHAELFESFGRVSGKDIAATRSLFPGIPEDYLAFLENVGFGSVKGSLMIYEGPTRASEILGDSDTRLKKIVLFGDDFAGMCFGFDVENEWQVVELASDHGSETISKTFTKFMKKLVKRIAKY